MSEVTINVTVNVYAQPVHHRPFFPMLYRDDDFDLPEMPKDERTVDERLDDLARDIAAMEARISSRQ